MQKQLIQDKFQACLQKRSDLLHYVSIFTEQKGYIDWRNMLAVHCAMIDTAMRHDQSWLSLYNYNCNFRFKDYVNKAAQQGQMERNTMLSQISANTSDDRQKAVEAEIKHKELELDLEQKKLETQLQLVEKQLELVEQVEKKEIEKSLPKLA